MIVHRLNRKDLKCAMPRRRVRPCHCSTLYNRSKYDQTHTDTFQACDMQQLSLNRIPCALLQPRAGGHMHQVQSQATSPHLRPHIIVVMGRQLLPAAALCGSRTTLPSSSPTTNASLSAPTTTTLMSQTLWATNVTERRRPMHTECGTAGTANFKSSGALLQFGSP